MRCYFHFDEKTRGKYLIPYCWSVLNSNDIEDCDCEKYTTFAGFERQKFNEILTEKNKELAEMEKEILRLNKRVESLCKKNN